MRGHALGIGKGMTPALAAVVGAENLIPVPCGSAVATRFAPAIAGALAQYCLYYPRSFDQLGLIALVFVVIPLPHPLPDRVGTMLDLTDAKTAFRFFW